MVTGSNNHSHRSGGLHQSNKKNKRTVASKRSVNKRHGGRVNKTKSNASSSSMSIMSNGTNSSNKLNRRNLQKQIRNQKIAQMKLQKNGTIILSKDKKQQQSSISRSSSNINNVPPMEKPSRMVGIISLSSSNHQNSHQMEYHVQSTLSSIATTTMTTSANNKNTDTNQNGIMGCYYAIHKRDGYITYITSSSLLCNTSSNNNDNDDDDDNNDTAIIAALDMARICDCILFIIHENVDDETNHNNNNNKNHTMLITSIDISAMSQKHTKTSKYSNIDTSSTTYNNKKYDSLISERGDRILVALKGQGLSTPITILIKNATDIILPNPIQNTTTNITNIGDVRNIQSINSNLDNFDGMDDGDDDDDDDDDDDMDMNMTLPTMGGMKSIHRNMIKRRYDIKKYVTRFATTEFGTTNNKVMELILNNNNDTISNDTTTTNITSKSNASATALVRTIATMSCHPPLWVSQSSRPYIVNELQSYIYNQSLRTLSISGYVRSFQNVPLDIHSLFHIPNIGTYTCTSILQTVSPWQQKKLNERRKGNNTNSMNMIHTTTSPIPNENQLLLPKVVADPDRCESLNLFATPDALDGEQNLIGFDDDHNEDDNNNEEDDDAFHDNNNNNNKGIARPAGWSDYQSAWIDPIRTNDNNDNHSFSGDTYTNADGDGMTHNNNDELDHGELANELNRKRSSNRTIGADGMDVDEDDYNAVTPEERQILLDQRKKQFQEENEFPDEVQVPEDIKARDRFARYRSLKSFRTSFWDPKENLPDSYATIYHFQNFKQTQRTVLNDMKYIAREAEAVQNNFFGKTNHAHTADDNDSMMDDKNDDDDDVLDGCIPSGSYVTLTFENVPNEAMERISSDTLLTAVALLPHENKVSVLHMGLCQSNGCDSTNENPIKSKDVLTFRCGWRTWSGRPVFSQNNLNCDKHKYERFLPTNGTYFAASIFGPITYTPCPVLVFRDTIHSKNINDTNTIVTVHQQHNRELVAIGSMLGADADRIVIKRIVLTGYPVRVHKRHATVKYMFYDPEDVKWFKPAGLHTKHGLQGNIVQSVGEHGTMKCLFNAPIKQHDTVCLPLYKRIYPKYVTDSSNRDHFDANDTKTRSGVTTYRENKPSLVIL
jgi:pre-rRNA-processing protein TSR1